MLLFFVGGFIVVCKFKEFVRFKLVFWLMLLLFLRLLFFCWGGVNKFFRILFKVDCFFILLLLVILLLVVLVV